MPITTELMRRLGRQSPQKLQDFWDADAVGLVFRARPSGIHSWRVRLADKRWLTLGLVKELTLTQAREAAREARAKATLGTDPRPTVEEVPTLEAFLSTATESHASYEEWLTTNNPTGVEDIARLRVSFKAFLAMPLPDINASRVEKWRTARRKAGIAKSTTNRDLNPLRAALSKALEWGLLTVHPLGKVKNVRVDTRGVVRYLTQAEEQALRDALTARDVELQLRRVRANAWRAARGYPEWPAFGAFSDYLTPLTLLALNTGLRRGELFQLRWRDVNFELGFLTACGLHTKNGQTRHVPLNAEARSVLRSWRPADAEPSGYVFPGKAGAALVDIKTAWHTLLRAAGIKKFRFHDTRHHFASKLVMAGVDLNTVRELLGHATLEMVLRYAHLAPEHTAAAVAKLIPPGKESASS